ncbi:type II toxin-antitoxin system VapC family toxin [Cryptosporangium phraense]|uniref:Ribonuclease VapC n=1 Tax=Cryptosporangium phraense TaxID=2593070 RepID=A0A545AIX6_9ACTN|nr:type II toxin-antitoxin system VapC family toxin [Cryptosporangium phraense]TQS41263.1 type II toxin-antitoxin system VapC family toxin [Cryptosporangium phraense]
MIVVDACVLADAMMDDGPVGDAARSALSADLVWAAPTHLFVEVLSVVRKKARAGALAPARAAEIAAALPELVIDQVDAVQLTDRIWELRENLTTYDAAYVAAAELYECAVVTSDARLAKAPGVRCPVELL